MSNSQTKQGLFRTLELCSFHLTVVLHFNPLFILVLSQCVEEMTLLFSGFLVAVEIIVHLIVVILYIIFYFSLSAFDIYFLSWVSHRSIQMCLDVDVFTFCLGVVVLLRSKHSRLSDSEKFSDITFLSIAFPFLSFFLSLYILLIMLLQLSHFFLPFVPLCPAAPHPSPSPLCPHLVHVCGLHI